VDRARHTASTHSAGIHVGVDVGGRRKGFHIAVLDSGELVELVRSAAPDAAASLISSRRPDGVGLDSPAEAAPAGERSRPDERALAAAVCGIRWTPAEPELHSGNPYYEWIVCGLELRRALADRGIDALEVFPTASWTRWIGPRAGEPRARWSERALRSLGIGGLPDRLDQDERDAVGAAATAAAHAAGAGESFGRIVVPARAGG
jgi:predicted nuclease with RNAse H fold